MVLYLIIRGSHRIFNLSQGSSSSLLTGDLFLHLVWPLIITVAIWLIAPLTLWRKPHRIASVYVPSHSSHYSWLSLPSAYGIFFSFQSIQTSSAPMPDAMSTTLYLEQKTLIKQNFSHPPIYQKSQVIILPTYRSKKNLIRKMAT